MLKQISCIIILICCSITITAQDFYAETPQAKRWVKKQFRKLNKDQRIAQLLIIRAHSNLGADHVADVKALITKYNVGGLCFFQGGPVRQALLTNEYQQLAKTPLMICIDGEWGLGMRLDSVINFPRQLMMGALSNPQTIYAFGRAVGLQCKRMGIQVNYAPDVDVNNNPLNPVINDRSFGENKYKVAAFGTAYMQGMQDVGVMATAKHFPGHGDVAVDSHYDLPIITKTKAQLDSLELFPFKALIKAGVGSVMIAHLYIPAIDTTANLATTLSKKNVTDLLRNELGYKGLSFTDALEMKGVTKFFPAGEAAVQALIAGNDLLCLPGDVEGSITKVRLALKEGTLNWDDINARIKKVLLAKYHLGLHKLQPIDTAHLVDDLNSETNAIRHTLSKEAITIVRKNNSAAFPLSKEKKAAYLAIGAAGEATIANALKKELGIDVFYFASKAKLGKQLMDEKAGILESDNSDSSALLKFIDFIKTQNYDQLIVGVHNYSRRPANNYGLKSGVLAAIETLQQTKTTFIFFGNPYAIKFAATAPNIMAAYEDDELTQLAVADILLGKAQAKGVLPVTVTEALPFGTSVSYNNYFPTASPETVGMSSAALQKIDAIANNAIAEKAIPGCVVLVARKGKIVYNKAFGYTNFDKQEPIHTNMLYDLASVTKISATTVSVMKLYEEGKLDLNKTLGDYIPWTVGTDKAGLKIKDILLHQAGLVPFIPFYRELIDTVSGKPLPIYLSAIKNNEYPIRVAENIFLRNDWTDTLHKRIILSKLSPAGKYVYSDNDFIFLGRIVETLSGKSLNEYVQSTFYRPLNMRSTGFKPRDYAVLNDIVPTEDEKQFRNQLIRGDVHDEGASLFGGVAGHAGLFSNAYDLAQLYQMLLNGGAMNGIQYLTKETIDLFTAYGSDISRRGLGFDKPEKDNTTRKDAYPSKSVSSKTYGHTGFTGTCVWVDPEKELVYIFLSNRVTPTRNNSKFGQMNVRPNIQEAIYQALE